MSAASQVWHTLEIRIMILNFLFAKCSFSMHNPDNCRTRTHSRDNETHIAVFRLHRAVMLHAYPIFLARSKFSPAFCFCKESRKHRALPYFSPIPWQSLSAIKNLNIYVDEAYDFVVKFRNFRRGGGEAVTETNHRFDLESELSLL